jgi:hypothetical protein
MTAAVDRLEKLGLVLRKASPSDRRSRVLELTAEGKRLAASCFKKHANDLGELMSALSEKEMQQLHGSLKKLGLLAAAKLGNKKHGSGAIRNGLQNDHRVRETANANWHR